MSKKQIAEAAAQRLMGWNLPGDFQPDGYIAFDKDGAKAARYWPTGTNLLNVAQARIMFEDCLPDNVHMKRERKKLRVYKDKSYKIIELSDYGKTLSKETLKFADELCVTVSMYTHPSASNYYRALVGVPHPLDPVERPEQLKELIEVYHMKERIVAFDKFVRGLLETPDRKKVLKLVRKLYSKLPDGSVLKFCSAESLEEAVAEQEFEALDKSVFKD